jgi:hypothetical protein
MARSFNGSTKLTRADTCGISGYPVTFACWFNPANVTANHGLINFGNSTNNGWYLGLWADGSAVGDPINAVIVYNPAAIRSGNTSAFSASTWQHAAGVFTSTALQSWLNGVSGSASSNLLAWPPTDRTGVGALERATPDIFLNGSCAEAAIWNVALTDDEIKALAAGLSPPHVRPGALVAYWPLFARATNEEDWVGGNTLTVTGATAADHPRIIYPAWPEIILPAAAAADSSGTGSSSGSSTVTGAGSSINAQAGSSAGSASVSGVGASTNAQAGSSAGSASVSGVGASTNAQAGSSSGTATVSGVGASIHEAAGASAGTATVSGVGDSTSAGSAAGSSAGAATVSGVGASVHAAVGTAAGISSASGVSFVDEAQIEVVLSLRGGSGGGSSGPEYRGDSIAYRYGVSTPGITVRREPLEETDDTEESPEPEKSVVPEAQPSLTLEDVRRAYRKLAALEVSEPIRATRDEIEREIAEAQADQAALRALMIRIDAVLTEIRQEEDEIAMLLIMAAA